LTRKGTKVAPSSGIPKVKARAREWEKRGPAN